MSGYVQEHIDALNAAKSAVESLHDKLLTEADTGSSKVTGALEGIDDVVAQRIGDTVTSATSNLKQTITGALESVTAAIDAEITAAQNILEHA